MRHNADLEDTAFPSRFAAFMGQARVQQTMLEDSIVNAMHPFAKIKHKASETLVETAGQPADRALHFAVPFLRQKIIKLRCLLAPVFA